MQLGIPGDGAMYHNSSTSVAGLSYVHLPGRRIRGVETDPKKPMRYFPFVFVMHPLFPISVSIFSCICNFISMIRSMKIISHYITLHYISISRSLGMLSDHPLTH